MNGEAKYAGRKCKKKKFIINFRPVLAREGREKKATSSFLGRKALFLKNKQELFENLCVHKLNSVPRKRRIYMIPALVGICFILFVLLFISD